MFLIIKILTATILLAILVEDLKFRAVHAWLFPVLLVGFTFLRLQESHWSELLFETSLNIGLITCNLVLATTYFSIKNRRFVILTTGLIGWGDILLFISITAFLPFQQFVWFFPLSLLFSLCGWFALSASKAQASRKVPLAGLQALFVLGWLVLDGFKLLTFLPTFD